MDSSVREFYERLLLERKSMSANVLALLDKGDFFMVCGKDAESVCREVLASDSMLKFNRDSAPPLPYITLSKQQLPTIIRHYLLGRQCRVELYDCRKKFALMAKASPGNLADFEDMFLDSDFSSSDSGCLMAVKLGESNSSLHAVGVCVCDLSSSTFTLLQFTDGNHFSNLESCIVFLSAKECILSSESQNNQYQSIKSILKRANIPNSDRPKGFFTLNDSCRDRDIEKLLKSNKDSDSAMRFMHLMASIPLATDCVNALAKHLDLLNDPSNHGRFTIEQFNLDGFVRLDSNAVRSLELFSSSYTQSRKGTLYNLLNRCRSNGGQKMLEEWIRQPLADIAKIHERLAIVEGLVNNFSVRSALHGAFLCKVPDLGRIESRFRRRKGTLQDAYKIYQVIGQIPKALEALAELKDGDISIAVKNVIIEPLQHSTVCFGKFCELVNAILDFEYLFENEEYRIKPSFDENLNNLSKEIESVTVKIKQQFKKASQALCLEAEKGIKLEANGQQGFYFRVTKKDEKLLRKATCDFIIVDSQRGGVRFTTSALDRLNDDYYSLKENYNLTQKEILEHALEIFSGYTDPLKVLASTIAKLDVLVSFAVVSTSCSDPYVKPTMRPKGLGQISLKESRHPCLETLLDASFIPNSVNLIKGSSNVCIVTGPNMGGKSTYLRQTALVVLMAHIGCFVPCEEATISVVDAIFTRIGACDYQYKGISTFMAEMLDSALIIEAATENSLVIIDELGRGTSTYDGFGLAWAITEHLTLETKSFCLLSTHFHELTEMARKIPGVKNVRTTAQTDQSQLTLLYRIEDGISEESFGINVAEILKFPKSVVEAAKEKLMLLEGGTDEK